MIIKKKKKLKIKMRKMERLKDFLKGDEFDWVEIGESE